MYVKQRHFWLLIVVFLAMILDILRVQAVATAGLWSQKQRFLEQVRTSCRNEESTQPFAPAGAEAGTEVRQSRLRGPGVPVSVGHNLSWTWLSETSEPLFQEYE